MEVATCEVAFDVLVRVDLKRDGGEPVSRVVAGGEEGPELVVDAGGRAGRDAACHVGVGGVEQPHRCAVVGGDERDDELDADERNGAGAGPLKETAPGIFEVCELRAPCLVHLGILWSAVGRGGRTADRFRLAASVGHAGLDALPGDLVRRRTSRPELASEGSHSGVTALDSCHDQDVKDTVPTARSFVAIKFDESGDGTGPLGVYAQSHGFAGHGVAYFDALRLAEFAVSLDAFPLPAGPLELAGGFWRKDVAGELEQELVGLRFYPVGGRGQVGVGVHLAGECWPDTRPASVSEVRLELLTTYERLRTFSRDFAGVARGQLGRAELYEEILI